MFCIRFHYKKTASFAKLQAVLNMVHFCRHADRRCGQKST